MGIRYDRDSRRATNGPMIFFSNLKDETFCEEIRSAFISGLSFYAYRMPGDLMLSFGSTEGYLEGIGEPGFVVGMFSPDKPFITIPYKKLKRGGEGGSYYMMPERSTTKEEYCSEVEKIKEAIGGDLDKKIVAARVVVEYSQIDLGEKFYELCERFPNAYVFCFSTPATGCWIGASPELLLQNREGLLETMALAGTRRADIYAGNWDEKNIKEQKIVAEYIEEVFRKHGLAAVAGETFTKKAGPVEHICTPITALSPAGFGPEELLRDLSPTPALCGEPKDFALGEIINLERFDRGCYGGFCGPYHSERDFTLNVVIRCGAVTPRHICKYAGGGITAQSDAEAEWIETELKLKSLAF
ncbi:MAG: chorismate-binding protein [Muribaculaceae bacterium]|nr:chorismate-binding protein [Muribaculaceae bacterium]